VASDGHVWLRELSVANIRNLEPQRVAFAPTFNVVVGDNGHGKTSLIEAVYIGATSKSFRTNRLRDVVCHGRDAFSIRTRFVEQRGALEPLERTHDATFDAGSVSVLIDGNRPPNLAAFARGTPVVVFHPDELQLSKGPAALRRRVLDRVALYRSAAASIAAQRYARALRARQELLRRQGDAGELDAYEEVVAQTGAALTRAREEASAQLIPHVVSAFQRIAACDLALALRYVPGGEPDAERFRDQLAARRSRDARSVAATFGPHRDELAIELGGHPAKSAASQGQHRAIALALKAGECRAIEQATTLWPIQLFDDISSELDPTRTEALLSALRDTRGQLFITTTRRDLIERAIESEKSSWFHMVKGTLQEG
jgi:DNA replication and repair protein RecF